MDIANAHLLTYGGDQPPWEKRPDLDVTGHDRSCGQGSEVTEQTSACGLGLVQGDRKTANRR